MSRNIKGKWKKLMVILLAIAVHSVESYVAGQYDQYCSDTEDCNQVSGLTCQNHRCKCAAGGETVFSISKNRCVGAAGRECLRSGNETLCVDNSICRDYNYMFLCACKDGHYQSKDGNCYKIAKYGEPCREEDYACGDSLTTSVSCVEKRCRCLLGEENQYYDQEEGRCVSYAGSQCLFHYPNPCSDNSYCGEIAEQINGASFVVGHRCVCKVGYSYTKTRKCAARYGNPCDSGNSCNQDEFLGCVNGVCQCRNLLNEVYDKISGKCSLVAGSRCVPDSGPMCITNAECVSTRDVAQKSPSNGSPSNNSTARPMYRCRCSNGYSMTPMGTCLVDYNQRCNPSADLSCNYHNGLVCINSTCACVDSSLSYDKSTKSCVALIGGQCGQIQIYDHSDFGSSEGKEITVLCEGNAICAKSHASSSGGNLARRVCRVNGSSPGKN